MRRKQLKICITLIVLTGLLNSFLLHIIVEKKAYYQHYTESPLPRKLSKQSESNPKIRVLIKSNHYKNISHEKVELSSKSGLQMISGNKNEKYAENVILKIDPDAKWFKEGNTIIVKPQN